MNFSGNYSFYPNNSELVKAVEHYKKLGGDENDLDDAPDSSVTVKDIFIHTRGNFELRLFNTNVLEHAQDSLCSLLTEKLREQKPLQWAAIHNSLGNILAALGQQRMDVGLYENAIASFSLALKEFSQENTPSEWAEAQFNLGTATQALGKQQDDSKLLKASVDAFTNVLLVWTRKKTPLEWATTMYQLGASFHSHGKQLKGNRTLEKAVVAFKNALVGFDADNHALELAATHNSRGAVLQNLAESEHSVERFTEAIGSYETALTVCMEQQLPFHLAVLCRVNKSTAKGALAELTRDPVAADEVADDFELIIECFLDSLQPLCLKHCQRHLEYAKTLAKKFGASV